MRGISLQVPGVLNLYIPPRRRLLRSGLGSYLLSIQNSMRSQAAVTDGRIGIVSQARLTVPGPGLTIVICH